MSNSALNFHIRKGSPAGEMATLDEVADWLGDYASDLEKELAELKESHRKMRDAFFELKRSTMRGEG